MTGPAKPKFLPWNEEEFQADFHVRAMTPKQRWMYRTLLQTSFFVTSRPRLPNDDNQLWALAGCDSKREWLRNKSAVMARFTAVEVEGVELIENKRVIKDWDVLLEARDRMVEMGKRSAAVRRAFNPGSTQVQPTFNLGLKPCSTREVKVSKEKLSEDNESGQNEESTDMAFIQNIEKTARRVLKFTKDLHPQERRRFNAMKEAFTSDRVESDFEAWAEENRDGSWQQPFSAYLKICVDRLKGEPEAEVADDPRIRQVTAKVYEMTGRLPMGAGLVYIQRLLTKYEIADILSGFTEYHNGLDDFERKWAVKNYFTDGAAEIIIDGIIEKRKHEAKWVVNDAEVDPFAAPQKSEAEIAREKEYEQEI